MSLADAPVYSNGDKTVTVPMKSSYKWSDGQPVTSQDALFWFDMVSGRRGGEPGRTGATTPRTSASRTRSPARHAERHHARAQPEEPVNPTWFTEDELYDVQPMPAHAWAKATAGGPILDFTNPANAKKIYDFLATQSKSHRHLRDEPAVAGRGRAVQADLVQRHHRQLHDGAEPDLRRPAADQIADVQTSRSPPTTAEFNALLSGSLDVGYVPTDDVPQVDAAQGARATTCSATRLGFAYVDLQLQGQDRRLQQHHQPALHPAGARAPGGRAGLHQGRSSTAPAASAYGPVPGARRRRTPRRTR